ncbi:MAG: PHP domain protein [Methanothrix sp.]|nr:MAG: PHP domain protein [Methanothrix sp.]
MEEILKAALEAGLDGIAITDHDTLEGFFEAERIVAERGLDLLIIPGVEVSTSEGHLLALGLRELPPPGRSPQETSEFARARGGITIVSHPYHLFRHSMYRIPECDAVEVYNSKYIFGIANFWAKRMAERCGLPMVAGSDSHMAGTVGLGVTVVEVEEGYSLGDVLASIRGGRVKIESKRMSITVFASQMVRWLNKRLRRRLKIERSRRDKEI